MSIDDRIRTLIAAFTSSRDPRIGWVMPGVVQHQFLPLYLGWNAVFGLRSDGSLVRWDFEVNPDHVSDLTSPFSRRMALFQGVKRYPQLAELLPTRPADAAECSLCRGSGDVPGRADLICECGGAGWLVTGEVRDASIG